MTQETPRLAILKIDNSHYAFDRYRDKLMDAGYQVIRAANFKEAVRLARRAHPNLILLLDNQKIGLDAVEWVEIQHADADPALAMIPLLILVYPGQVAEVRLQELPDRVQTLQRPIEMDTVLESIKKMIEVWR